MTLELWPTPAPVPSPLCPSRLAGATPESTKTLLDVLKKNHEKWHVFYDDLGRHNHISHHVLAVWALGAHADIVRAGYDKNESLMQPIGSSPGKVTRENWKDFLSDRSYYPAYVEFFESIVNEIGCARTVEEFVFSKDANYVPSSSGEMPSMVARFQDGIMHAYIHTGYGAEFGLPGMIVEGLAEAASSKAESTSVIPEVWFEGEQKTDGIISKLQSVLSLGSKTSGVNAFTVLSNIISDESIRSVSMGLETMYPYLMESHGEKIWKHVDKWTIDNIDEAAEELQFVLTVMYAVPGLTRKGEGNTNTFNADFLAAHFVTSGIFIPSILAYLTSQQTKILFLKSYYAVCLAWFIAIGKPTIDVGAFMEGSSAAPTPSSPQPKTIPSKFTLSSDGNPNPWTHLIREAIAHPDDHFPKCQRALMHYASLYGSKPKDSFSVQSEKGAIVGLEKMDGTLFVRTAGLTQERLGREFEEEPHLMIYWDRRGYGGNWIENTDLY